MNLEETLIHCYYLGGNGCITTIVVCLCACVYTVSVCCTVLGDLDVVVCGLGHEEFTRDLHLSGLGGEVTEEATLLLDQEELGQLLGLGLQDLDPLLELRDEVVELHGARHAEVKVCMETDDQQEVIIKWR